MKRLIIGSLAALAIGLGVVPVAQAHPCSPDPVCHEFDWAIPYYEAFDRHGIGYLADREGIPLMEATDTMCREKKTSAWNYFSLTTAEFKKIVEAAADVCPEVVG